LAPYLEWPLPECEKEHGVVMEVPRTELPRVLAALSSVYGAHVRTWRKFHEARAVYDVEFVVGRPRKPWDHCGASMLFRADMEREQAAMQQASQFKEGDSVFFTHERRQKFGLVARVNAKRCTVVVKGEGTYYVPGKDMHIDE
jgi:hypothetical protein